MNQHFASLILGLAYQAEAALSGELPGVGEEGAPDGRTVAQGMIDTLAMLQEKTRGHLEDDERKLLDESLTTLKFRFVKAGEGK